MNISQPIASSIESVDFEFLSSAEIRDLSVKRIQNPETFDKLLHPVPLGLHDAALGAWEDNPCSTCHLTVGFCPGHMGHISLPVPVYHPTFMDQLLRLLRGQCEYCHHLKLNPTEIHRFISKLRLLQNGLIKEAGEVDNLQVKMKGLKLNMINGREGDRNQSRDGDEDSEESEDEFVDKLVQRRNEFVTHALDLLADDKRRLSDQGKIEALYEERRTVIKEFLSAITKGTACGKCKGISRPCRKVGYHLLFKVPLGKRQKDKMTQARMRPVNPLIAAQEKRASQKLRREEREIDEGIVADIEDVTSDEDLLEPDTFVSESNSMNGNVFEGEAAADSGGRNNDEKGTQQYITPEEVRAYLNKLFEKEKDIFSLIYRSRPGTGDNLTLTSDMFFITDVSVPPSKYRPIAKTGDGQIAEADQNTLYKSIMEQCRQLYQIMLEMKGASPAAGACLRDFNDLQNVWVRLQHAVNSVIDSDRNPMKGAAAKQNPNGIKQILEKKEGLFRKNMMGKRVNFAARSVISPDPNIETNEIGVPPVFAVKLTYPEPVTNHNFYDLKQAVLNGPKKWPGAAAIENENGQVINLRTKSFDERQALANQLLAPSNPIYVGSPRHKKVYRHLNNGDIVLMNRQPTLHKPSIMGHRARILPGEKTIRMHYANCNTYNADFDGDEMNMHFPQNELARVEALQIADTDHQYLSATAGKPLRGLIQDHISMSVWLSNKDTFFERDDYYQLLYNCLRPENNDTMSNRIETVIPAILKPQPMWTGKQVITTILQNIAPITHPGLTLLGKSQTAGDQWGQKSEEGVVSFRDGELLCGILDKAHLGPSGGGLIHCIYETYGHTIAGKLLSVLGRLLTKYLSMRAFSCGIEDLVLTKEGNRVRRQKLEEADEVGLEIARKYVTMDTLPYNDNLELRKRLEDVLRDNEKQAGLDDVYKSRASIISSEVTSACLPACLEKTFPYNQMQLMTTSGAKGTPVNANQISCNLGQQVLEGRRVPVMVSGKTLPCFKPFETMLRAGGYITDRFLTGVKPQEYFFHAMAGREGLIDTAVKTSRSGYLQRCLIKAMEGLTVQYDTSVRDSDGSIIQFLYGEDGLDVTKQKFLTDFRFLLENYLSLVAQLNIREEFHLVKNDEASDWHKAAMKKVKKTANINAMDPALAVFNPASVIGSTSEAFATSMKAYCDANPDRLLQDKKKSVKAHVTKKTFSALMEMKYLKSVVEPGEAVGVVAGQSIGEPSTQMTLNTFHLAGHATKNVTLGIPRLREIVMTASSQISTPTMTLHLIPEITVEAGQRFAKGITKLTLAEVTKHVSVSERIGQGVGFSRAKIYDIRLDFYPRAEYKDTYDLDMEDLIRTLERKYVATLTKKIKKEMKEKSDSSLLRTTNLEVGKSNRVVEDAPSRPEATRESGNDDMEDDDSGDDGDATTSKKKQNRAEATSYAAPDEGEEEIATRVQREATPTINMEDEGFEGSPRESMHEDADNGTDSDVNDSIPLDGEVCAREDRVKNKNTEVTRFIFDDRGGAWCEIQLEYDVGVAKIIVLNHVEAACHDSVIQSIPNLGSCTFTEENGRDPDTGKEISYPVVITEGVNLAAMHDYQSILNPHKIFTNDIAAILSLYGVEACRATIILEMDAVFKGHSITVDNRHLNLIADMMTRGGGFSPFNRNGMKNGAGPFMKMSFETTTSFLRDAVLEQDWDDLKGPSARIVTGKAAQVGTGFFKIMNRIGTS